MKVQKSNREPGIYCLKINNYTSGIQSFLYHNPFIYLKNNKLYGCIYEKNLKFKEEIIHKYKKYWTRGISKINYISDCESEGIHCVIK
jgi:hypothetical protein